MDIQTKVNLKNFNSWKVGGDADFFCVPETEIDILQSVEWAHQRSLPVTLLGGGTNVLISDKGVRGLLIHTVLLKNVKQWEDSERLCVSALAGVAKADVMKIFLKYQLAPALFLCGLPGGIAGGVVMNAGVAKQSESEGKHLTLPSEFKDIVDWVKVIREGRLVHIKKEDIQWEYRFSSGWQPGVIYEVGMSWPKEPIENFTSLLQQIALRRARTQPLQSSSCGSVFKNPLSGKKAGQLIEQCQLKGYQIGGAIVSEKHANFIVNAGHAKAIHIHQLIQHIQQVVQKQTGVLLKPEIKYVGEW